MLSRRDFIGSTICLAASDNAIASTNHPVTHSDGDRFVITGRRHPVSMASPNKPWSYVENNGSHQFEVRAGDVCISIDGARAKQKDCPERCMIVWQKARPFFKTTFFSFNFNVSAIHPNFNPWMLLAQYHNHADLVAPGQFEPWCSPPLAIMLAPDPSRKGETIITISGRYVKEKTNTVCPTEMILGSAPFKYGQDHSIKVKFVNGRGGVGSVLAEYDGVVIANYEGPIGFNDEVGCYFSLGAYRSPQHLIKQNFRVAFRDIDEGTEL